MKNKTLNSLLPVSLAICIVLSSLLISSCNINSTTTNIKEHGKQTVQATLTTDEIKINEIVAQYTQDTYELYPLMATFRGKNEFNNQFTPEISDKNSNKSLALEKKYLDAINSINPMKLQGQILLTYKIFKSDRLENIQAYQYPYDRLPLNQMFGLHNLFAELGSGESVQPFKTEQDYRNFMKRSEGFSRWLSSVEISMRQGIKDNIVLPKPIVEKLIPQFETHVVKNLNDSVFYSPLRSLPETLNDSSKKQLIADYEISISQVIIPAYRRFHNFLKDEYLPNARTSVGLSFIPNGKAWYEYLIQSHTTLPLSADEIHQYGLSEVSRILSEMKAVKQQVNFKGDMADFFNFLRNDPQFYFEKPEELIAGYIETKHKINATLPKLFEIFPKTDYVVKPVPAFQSASYAGASYQEPSPDGTRPGVFFINTYNMKSQPKFLMETLSIHEASPGHHFQTTIQQEVEALPDFRKFGGYSVFNEGWALYAESLGKELGLFTDPYMWYGRLVDEQLRAMRLVVDTGLHAFGWSREEAINYMLANSSMARSDVEAEVERYIVIPGQALSYKIGQRKIRQLREKATKILGSKFDIKKFHTQILIDGSLPMPILEEKIDSWIETQKSI